MLDHTEIYIAKYTLIVYTWVETSLIEIKTKLIAWCFAKISSNIDSRTAYEQKRTIPKERLKFKQNDASNADLR